MSGRFGAVIRNGRNRSGGDVFVESEVAMGFAWDCVQHSRCLRRRKKNVQQAGQPNERRKVGFVGLNHTEVPVGEG